MRIMGLDYGASSVGVSISDELLIPAQGIEVIRRQHENKLRKTYARIEELAQEYHVTHIIVGHPKNMDNTIGRSAVKAEEFADNIRRRSGLTVELWDERLTTVSAHKVLEESGAGLKKKMEVVDKVAAVFILQSYLNYISNFPKENFVPKENKDDTSHDM